MAPAAVIDCPRGVAPERMPKADATGLAPKKSADRTLPHTIRRCGRVWLPPCPPALILPARPNPRCRARENKPHFFGGALSGGRGLKTRRPPGRFCRALRIRFFALLPPGYRPCLYGQVSYPTRAALSRAVHWADRKGS